MRTLVIGDMHGGLKALTQVLERASVTLNDHLIFLGDYVDGWSESAQLVDFLIHLSSSTKCTFIKGNHDQLCEDWLTGTPKNALWLKSGGRASIESYKALSSIERSIHIQFFQNMPSYLVDEQNRLFVHAGFTSIHGAPREFNKKNYNWDRTLWEVAFALKDCNLSSEANNYPRRLKHYKEIYIGHTHTTQFGLSTPTNALTVWNMDTGAGFDGKISIMDIDTKDFWQSDQVASLYPLEKGRN